MAAKEQWPSLGYEEWLQTCETLHLYTQVAGKIKLELAPFLNEWWHVALAVWSRGITTGPIPFGVRLFEIRFDFVSHKLDILDSIGNVQTLELTPRPVAEFYSLVLLKLHEMDIEVALNSAPQEIEDTIPLDTDTLHRSYDRVAVERFWSVLSRIAGVFEQFRSGFSGKSSPVHFWWGGFDLNLTRFSGRLCTPPPKAGRLARIDCDEEHFSAGFWPGNEKLPQPAFYAYGYPAPKGIEKQSIRPSEAAWNPTMGEFILPYHAVCSSPDPEQAIMEFLTSTYEAIANIAEWDRAFLERKIQ